MQTFLPYASFHASAQALDDKRLGKQIMEARQILTSLAAGPGAPWYGHPAVQMWIGLGSLLADYGWRCCEEWTRRFGRVRSEQEAFSAVTALGPLVAPWHYSVLFQGGHRGHLYRKDPVHYAAFAAYKDCPLLYPVLLDSGDFALIERVSPGKFRAIIDPGPFGDGRHGPAPARSVKDAVAAAGRSIVRFPGGGHP